MRRADLAVLRRREVRADRRLVLGDGCSGLIRGVGIVEAVECIEDADAECECRARPLGGGTFKFETELEAEAC